MFYLENNTTFSGSDIKVYVYKDVNDFKRFQDKDLKRKLSLIEDPLYPDDPYANMDPSKIDEHLSNSLEGIASKRPGIEERRNVQIPGEEQKSNLTPEETQKFLNENKAPEIEKQPDNYRIPKNPNLPGIETRGNYGTEESAQKARAALVEAQRRQYEWIGETSGIPIDSDPEEDIPEIQKDPPYVKVKYKGDEFTMSEEDSETLKENHKDPIVTAAPPLVDYDAVQTNKVNPNYIDIVKTGGDKNALNFARRSQLAKMNTMRERNEFLNDKGKKERKPIIELGSLYSITYSSFREKHAVRTLGRVSAKDYTRGQRTIAGSMNFAVFQSHELMDFLRGESLEDQKVILLDQLPKFNIMLVMINEYGGASILHLFGVTISTESQQTSVEDLALMNSVTFYAEDIMTIQDVGNVFETSLSMLHPTVIAGRTLRFYKGNQFTTLSGLLSMEGAEKNNKLQSLINRSRGLF